MNAEVPIWLWPLTHLATALGFLLLGWKLGREASGRPMFDFPPGPPPAAPAGEEGDPWAEASLGRPGSGAGVDRNETESWP
jgi:hypothetical protein